MKKKYILIISLLIFIVDLLVKELIICNIKSAVSVIDNFFELTYVKNTGGAFSVLSGNVLLLAIISIIFLIYVIRYIKNKDKIYKLEGIGLSFILGGLIGNLIDRLFRNGVVDYLSFKIITYYFPVFNIADIFICLGVMLIIINEVRGDLLDNKRRKSKN